MPILPHVIVDPPARAGGVSFDREASDEMLVERALGGEGLALELLMRRNNQSVYRAVRSVLRDPVEIEDVMQQAYFSAFVNLDQYDGSAKWSTWVCRIAFNEALARLRTRGRFVSIEAVSEDSMTDNWKPAIIDPEREAGGREFARAVEKAVDRLPDIYRAVLILRQVEGLSASETGNVLGIGDDVVKTRLHRARLLLREAIEKGVGEQLEEAFSFGAERCDRVVAAVLARIKGEA